MREGPQHRIQLLPHLVGGMIPRRPHIQGQLGQGIESLDVRGMRTLLRVAAPCLFAHSLPSELVLDTIPGCGVTAASAVSTMLCASRRMSRRWFSLRKLSA